MNNRNNRNNRKQDNHSFKAGKKEFFKKREDKKTKPVQEVKPKKDEGVRLNKYIANSGICSRRDADLYIQSGNVMVNGKVITEMGYRVQPKDEVIFDGAKVSPEKKIYVLLNKPKGFSTSETDKVSNVQDLVRSASNYPLMPVGRMDKTTVGLLLLTNDNELVQKFTNASQRSSKLYQVSLDKNLKSEDLQKIEKGVFVNEHRVYVEEIKYVDGQPKSEIGIKVKTSNVKVVRSVFETLGYDVIKLDRVMFAGLTKWGLSRGQWRFLTEQEIINLKNI